MTTNLIVLLVMVALLVLYLLGVMVVYSLQYKKKKESHRNAELQIKKFVEDIQQKTRLIKELKKEGNSPQGSLLVRLQKTIILTEEDWGDFKNNFNEIYPNYINLLYKNYPKLTNSEMRLLVLAKLNLSYSEMSELQGVTSHAIRVTWYRLKDKLKLKEDISLKKFVGDIK